MKRMANSINASSKRNCFNDETNLDSSFRDAAVPPHHFYLELLNGGSEWDELKSDPLPNKIMKISCRLEDQPNSGGSSYVVTDRRSGPTRATCRRLWKQPVQPVSCQTETRPYAQSSDLAIHLCTMTLPSNHYTDELFVATTDVSSFAQLPTFGASDGFCSLPRRMGQLKDLSKFDNDFFDVSQEQANLLLPEARILLESTYEAIVDAGYDPDDLRGRNIGVFIANCYADSEEFFLFDIKANNERWTTGCNKSLLANRISQIFDFKGPSILIDTACSSGLVTLNNAVQSIQRGEIEAAVVGAVNLCLRPGTSMQFHKLGTTSEDGVCRSFDADALTSGQIRIPTNCTPWRADYAVVNSFGIGGVNVHVVLKSNGDKRNREHDIEIPQLVLYGGRTQENVRYLFEYLQTAAPSRGFVALLHKSVYSASKVKPYRGYKLLVKDEEIVEIKQHSLVFLLRGKFSPSLYRFLRKRQWPRKLTSSLIKICNPVKVHPEHPYRKPTHQIALNENIPNRKSKLTQIPLNTPESSSKIWKDKVSKTVLFILIIAI
ncbi:fatty acid synthase [Nephila pilipes]|uniref:Fatty acid synthase n=1 Tax=Nephila pilipes TaxID=299642 RepID=A0A8X6QHR8_NEPPI|nr:fatty acid synthase [Nephila pilipes]